MFAAVGATALAACGTSGGSSGASAASGTAGVFGSIPPQSGTPHAGTVRVAIPPAAAPSWILPVVTAADNSVYTVFSFDYEMWRPLYFEVNGVEPALNDPMSLATQPVWTNNNLTATITLKSNYKWSDGTPVTSADVLFWYHLMQAAVKESPANWAGFSPGIGIPDQVASVTAPNATTVVFNLKSAVNPAWFAESQIAQIQPMPVQAMSKASATGPILDTSDPANAQKVYDYLAGLSKPSADWATNPIWQTVDGPYKLTAFNVTTGAFTMVPNSAYGGPHSADYPTLTTVPFASDAAEVNAIKAGAVDDGYMPLNDFAQLKGLSKTWNEYGYPDFGWAYADYNFKDTTGDFNNIIKQLYVRQAIAHLENEPGYIKAFFSGAAGQAYGPVPALPKSPYTPANAVHDPYPYSITAAANLLKSHGWTVTPGGTDVCSAPGTAANQCGAGIPAGTQLKFNLIYAADSPLITSMMTDLVSKAKQAGINITLQSSNFDYMISNYLDPYAPANENKWAMQDFG
ncbi:MAG: ABC transporter substrate-binding protein, partial [Streptosporangiaceae bacterium]